MKGECPRRVRKYLSSLSTTQGLLRSNELLSHFYPVPICCYYFKSTFLLFSNINGNLTNFEVNIIKRAAQWMRLLDNFSVN